MATVKYLADIDLNKNALNNAVIQPLSTAPGSPADGQIYFDTDTADINVYNGSAWVRLGPTGAGDIESVVAGAGMTGGGTSGDATLNVIGGTGITANANDIALTNGLIADGSNITSVGTIGTGVWQGTTIKTAYIGDDQVTEDKLANTLLAEIDANTAKVTNVATNLSVASSTTSRIIASSDGTNATIPVATTSVSGVMSTGIFDAVVLNTAKSTNATHSGEVTGSGALTIAGNVVDEANLKVSNAPSNGYFLSAQSGNTGGLTWAAIPTLNQDTTGNADTATLAADATTLATPRAINGVNFDGSAAITVTAAAGTLSGDTLKSTVVTSSLTSVGTIATGAWNATVIPSAKLDADTAHLTTAQTFTGSKTMGTNVKLNFRDANAYINSPTANDIEVVGTTITLDAGSDIQLEGDTTVTGDFSITGTLNVDGTTTTIDSTTVAIADSMLKLAKDQANTADAVDFGFYGQYGVSGTHKYAGIFRDLSVSGDPFTFFDSLQAEPGATVNTSGTGYDLADISAGTITAADGFAGALTGDVTGKADTADTLETARTIGGVSFNGSANINLPGVNAAGNQATSGLAGTATKLATTRAINGVNFDGTAAITVTAAAGTLSGNTLKSTVVASSLTSVGTIATGIWRGTAIATAYIADDAVTEDKLANTLLAEIDANTAKVTNSATNLTATTHASQITLNSSDGNNVIVAQASGSIAGVMTVAHHDKLDGIEADATADQSKSDIDGLAITTVGTLDTGNATAIVSAASATAAGKVELATTAEALAGTDTSRAVTAAGLAARSYRAAIGDGSATAIAVTHSLGTKDVVVQMYDASSFETVYAQVVRNTTAQVTVTFNTAPTSGDVIILINKID
jgi:hypothetical protein